jgi:hypothetical protein
VERTEHLILYFSCCYLVTANHPHTPSSEMKIPITFPFLLLLSTATSALGKTANEFKAQGDELLQRGEYLGASRAYTNAIGQSGPQSVQSSRPF